MIDFVASVLNRNEPREWFRHGDLSPMFESLAGEPLHAFISDYLSKHGALPPKKLVTKHTGLAFGNPEGEPSYYHEQLRGKFIERNLQDAVEEAGKHLSNPVGRDPDAALATLRDAVVGLSTGSGRHSTVDYRESYDRVWVGYQKTLQGEQAAGLHFPFPTLRENGGGVEGGDLVSLVGRPSSGKTFMMLYMALRMWIEHRVPVVFSSQEMPSLALEQRLAAMTAGVPLRPLKTGRRVKKVLWGGMTHEEYEEALEEALSKVSEHECPFHIVDGKMAGTVQDLRLLCSSMRPGLIFVDGAYLLKHPDTRLNRYGRVAENCDLLKEMSVDLDVPVTCSWQFNRDAAKKLKKADDTPDLEDIGYSDAIGQHSSIVLGLLQREDIDTLEHRRVHVMKGRSGETGVFSIRWDFNRMDFSEVVDEAMEESGTFDDFIGQTNVANA